jgi:uncharacterized protein YlxW (UPF0749 family)
MVHSKDLEAQMAAQQVRLSQAADLCDTAKAQAEAKDQENRDILSHISKMRQKQNDLNLKIEGLTTELSDAQLVVSQMLTKV